jgi:hypothetical protein
MHNRQAGLKASLAQAFNDRFSGFEEAQCLPPAVLQRSASCARIDDHNTTELT